MKCMERNKQVVWFAAYRGKEEIVSDGRRTGQYKTLVGEPVMARAVVSAARGALENEQFGINVNYDRTILFDDAHVPVDDATVFWIEKDPKRGAEPWNYTVEKVARSLNSTAVAVKRVSVQ